ncbi:MAG TPA: GNAT family N-acetyltransferase [Solirubrobacterales bacterium]|nr:GNAT family N-acetyltransferase [Solirubrobacterales bacterium]
MTPSGVHIREARFGEEQQILDMYEWLFQPPGARPPGFRPGHALQAIGETLADRDATILLAVERDSRIGLCSIYLDLNSIRFGRRAWVEDLAVDPERRSAGVGHALMDAARAWGSEHGATHLELDSGETRTDAHRFYERESPSWRSNQYSWLLDP